MTMFSQEIRITNRYLHIPVRNGNPRVTIQMMIDGQLGREFTVDLADVDGTEWWAFYDVSAFQGQRILLRTVENIPEPQANWLGGSILQSDDLMGVEDLYHEKYRPQFHFTAKRGWNNDPNGLVYYQGEWHMFYQHNPFGVKWGNMHWGHAVSRDLVHWVELPEALYQKSLKDMAYSGGGLVDFNNTTGWKTGNDDPLVVAFTSTGRGECLAYSLDCGRTLVEFSGNPILAHQGRDPKIIWYEPGQHWVLIVYEEPLESGVGSGGHGTTASFGYAIYTSHNLKEFTRQSFLPGWYECPELFEIAVEDQPGQKLWVVYGCTKGQFNSAYQVGRFDGKTFTPVMEPVQAHIGPAFYAAQIFNHVPDNRRVMLGWLTHADYPGMPFSQGMTVPLELSLRATVNEVPPFRLFFNPVKELDYLLVDEIYGENLGTASANALLARPDLGELLDVQVELQASGPISFSVGDYPITWDLEQGEVSFVGKTASLQPGLKKLTLRLLVDRSVTEVFVDSGRAAFAAMTLFPEKNRLLRLEGIAEQISIRIKTLKSIWD